MAVQSSLQQIIQNRCPDPARWHPGLASSLLVGRLLSLGIRDVVTHHQPVKWEARALYGCRSGDG